MFTWAKFRLPSTGPPKNKARMAKGARGVVLAWGVLLGCFMPTRDARPTPTPAVLWAFPHTFQEDAIFAKYEIRGWGVYGVRDGQNSGTGCGGSTKQVGYCND